MIFLFLHFRSQSTNLLAIHLTYTPTPQSAQAPFLEPALLLTNREKILETERSFVTHVLTTPTTLQCFQHERIVPNNQIVGEEATDFILTRRHEVTEGLRIRRLISLRDLRGFV